MLDFGTTGKLRNSDLIMYDRQTESWWQQFTGQGIVGRFAGKQLAFLPSQVISFADFAAEFPDALVLARPGLSRSYGTNPYTNYDSSTRPFLFYGKLDDRLPATERIVGVVVAGAVKAYPFTAVTAHLTTFGLRGRPFTRRHCCTRHLGKNLMARPASPGRYRWIRFQSEGPMLSI